jgi:hypothetical protein
MPATFQPAKRSHTSFLAAAEKRTLIAIARRLPAWVNSDHLTAIGFIALLAAGVSYAFARQHPGALLPVIPLLALNWFGDSLDGTLARVRDCQRPRYGFYVDHILDAIGMSALMTGMAFSGYISPSVAAAPTGCDYCGARFSSFRHRLLHRRMRAGCHSCSDVREACTRAVSSGDEVKRWLRFNAVEWEPWVTGFGHQSPC